jgi:beta-phosphoglucomutase family hydrolase
MPTSTQTTTRAVIFDLDGVLVWTIPVHFSAFRETFAAEGKDFTFDDYMELGVGASRDEVIRRVLGEVDEGKLSELMEAKERHVRRYLLEKGLEPVPGSLEFLQAVRKRNLKTAVASASRTPRLFLESVGAAGLFDAIVDRGMVRRSKPAPDLFLLTAETVGAAPEECLVIEDSAVGVEAALAAGMRVIALTTTHDRARLARATAVYGGFEEIPLARWLG